MASITLTGLYSSLPDWPNRLLQAPEGTSVLTSTAKNFVFEYPAGSGAFSNFRVVVAGFGFRYDGGEPIAGRMTGVRILNASGELVVNFAKLGGNDVVNDLSQFYANVFGTLGNDNTGIGSRGETAWSHLMSAGDTITGTNSSDSAGLPSLDIGNDVYNMLGGNDWITGSFGDDTIDGGDGFDILSYPDSFRAAAIRGATINMQTGVVLDPWGGRDVVISVEEIRGSGLNDIYIGSDTGRDQFSGLRGRDTIDGGSNTFTPTGTLDGDSRDEVRYDRDELDGGRRGIVVDLETAFVDGSISGTIRDGFGNLDTVIDIERVVGTRFNDTFLGSQVSNMFAGGAGKDRYNGRAGYDSVDFGRATGNSEPTSGIVLFLSRAAGQVRNDGYGNVETVVSIESFLGTQFGDFVKGDAARDKFTLDDGADTMAGGWGGDTFVWESLDHFGDGDVVTDFQAKGPEKDILSFWTPGISGMNTTLTLINGTEATAAGVGTFVFDTAIDTLFWDGDGMGGDAAVAIVLLTGVNALSVMNFDLFT